jgi:acid phosphatase (class A)
LPLWALAAWQVLIGPYQFIKEAIMRLLTLAPLLFITPLASADQPASPPAQSRLGSGYLKAGEGPDSGKLLPPPPAEGSKALVRDHNGEARALKLQGTARWEQAKIDADIFTPNATGVMSCAAGRVIGPETTPKTNALLRKAGSDFGLSSYPAKGMYKRARPFMGNGKPVCTPEMGKMLEGDGSYPSGHAAIGYGWGMVLGDVLPKRKSQLLKRGKAFADSRRICNVHFLSDIEAGGLLANAVIEKLRANADYQTDVAAAKAELASLPPVKPDCAREKAALKIK